MATEIASAYVSLIPSFKGGQKAIADEFDGPAEAAGKESGKSFGGAFSGAFKGLLGAGAIFGGAAALASAFNSAVAQADLPGVFRRQFGQTEAVAAESAEIASAVYAEGWGSSLADVGAAVGEIQRQLDQLGQTGDVDELTESAQALADTFGQEVGGVITSASQLVKTGLAPDLRSAFDVMAAGFQAGIDTGGDFLDTITEYSVQFQGLGLDATTTFGLINQGLEAGARNSDLIADAFKEFQIRVTDGTAAEAFESIGLSAEEMNDALAEGGPAAQEALDTTLDRLRAIEDPAARDAAAFGIFGTQAEDLGESLYALDPSEAATELGDVAGAANEVADAMGDSTQQEVDELSRRFNEGLGEAMLKLEPLFSALLDVIIPLLPVLIPLAIAIGIVTVAVWAFNAALAANPITWIILGIVALIAAIVLLIVKWDVVWASLVWAWEELKRYAGIVWDWLVAKISGAWDWIVEKTTAIWNGIVGFFQGIWGWIVAKVTAVWDWIVAKISGAWDWIVEKTTAIWNGIVGFFQGIWDWMVSIARDQVQMVMDIVGWFQELPGRVADWFGGVYDAAVDKFNALVDWVQGVPDMILDALGDLGGLLTDVGHDVMQSFLDGIMDMWDSIQDTLSDLTDSLPDWKGPEQRDKKLLYQSGRWVIGSLDDGMEDEIPSIESTLTDLTSDIGMSVRPPSAVDPIGARTPDQDGTEPLVVQGPLIAVDSLAVDSDERVRELAQELWTRASRSDRARGQVLLGGVTR